MKHYIFDLDDNLRYMKTKVSLIDTKKNRYRFISTSKLRDMQHELGKCWDIHENSFSQCDDPDSFIKDVKESYEGPSWSKFIHAIKNRNPVSIITGRGLSSDVIRTGLEVLCDNVGLNSPNWLYVDGVTYNTTINKNNTVSMLKRKSINRCIDSAVERYGKVGQIFGMSDDDPDNIDMIICGMKDAKTKYPNNQYFVIDSNRMIKFEVSN